MGTRAVMRGVLDARPEPDHAADPEGIGGREAGWRGLLRRLDERYPALASWVGGRLDIEVPAILASVSIHALFLLVLATAVHAVNAEVRRLEFQSVVVDTSVANLGKSDFQDLDMGAEPPTQQVVAGSFAPDLAPTTVAASLQAAVGTGTPSPMAPRATSLELARVDVSLATREAVPTASLYGRTLSIRGEGAEHVGGVEGAVDRIADEILRRLEKGRTLVVWAFDASGSLQAERERLARHIGTVYTHIAQLDAQGLSTDGGLLTAVVAFGQDRKAMTAAPTADRDEIVAAIDAVPLDTSGVETTFQTVAEIVRRWGRYKDSRGNAYQAMVIVVTDEVGDDEQYLETAIDVAVKEKVPVYVLGSQALFGRAEGYMDYTDPKTGKTYRHIPVRQGPESVALEQIRLPFWYGGYQYDMLDSGFGPYALSRLAGATGGIYFITRLGPHRMGFDPVLMREYKPDWVSRKQYEASVLSHPIRKAVMEAALITQQQLPGQPAMRFPPADSPEFKEAMAKQQAIAARVAYTVDQALDVISPVARYRDQENSRRWQAHYDLIRGRLLAMKVRCFEYNWACARMKKDPPKLQGPRANAWKLVPDREIHYSEKAAAAAEEARALLQRVIDDHPETPWALLAAREIKDPFGFKWVETYVPPIRRDTNTSAKRPRPMPKPPTRPEEIPKL